jgi:predicted methyltransferase
MRRIWIFLVVAFLGMPFAYVVWQAIITLRVLDQIEAQRDTWQRQDDVIAALDLHSGQTVVDLGSGAGYFALKLAPIVGPGGVVLATDIRRESLTFLWMRAHLKGAGNLRVIHAETNDPRLPATPVDAVLVSNAYHELTVPSAMVALLRDHLKGGGRLVVLDHVTRLGSVQRREEAVAHHEVAPGAVENDLHNAGFTILNSNDRFIDRTGEDDIWWLLVAQKP